MNLKIDEYLFIKEISIVKDSNNPNLIKYIEHFSGAVIKTS
jgi:hypothetical protein